MKIFYIVVKNCETILISNNVCKKVFLRENNIQLKLEKHKSQDKRMKEIK